MRVYNADPSQTLQTVVDNLLRYRQRQPFRFSGRWFVVLAPDGQGYAFRNKRDAMRTLSKFPELHGKPVDVAVVG